MPYRKRTPVEDCASIDAHELVTRALSGDVVTYARVHAHGDRGTVMCRGQNIPLVTTRPRFGGRRWWFRCWCGQVAARLYLAPEGGGFQCRACHGLTYRSSQERRGFNEAHDRALAARWGCTPRAVRQILSRRK